MTTMDYVTAVLYGGNSETDLTVLWTGMADVQTDDGLEQRPVVHAIDDAGDKHNLYMHASGEWVELSTFCRDWLDSDGNEPPADLDIDAAFL